MFWEFESFELRRTVVGEPEYWDEKAEISICVCVYGISMAMTSFKQQGQVMLSGVTSIFEFDDDVKDARPRVLLFFPGCPASPFLRAFCPLSLNETINSPANVDFDLSGVILPMSALWAVLAGDGFKGYSTNNS